MPMVKANDLSKSLRNISLPWFFKCCLPGCLREVITQDWVIVFDWQDLGAQLCEPQIIVVINLATNKVKNCHVSSFFS